MIKRIFAILTVAAALLSLSACKTKETVFSVNGIGICEEEYEMAKSAVKSEVIAYYTENFDENDFGDGFWDREYKNAPTPNTLLKEKAEEWIKEKYAVMLWAKEEKLISEVGFDEIKAMFEKENSDRAEGKRNDSVVYGVSSFDTLFEYYDYYISDKSVKLRSIIENSLTESEISEYYEKNKDSKYMKPYVYKCRQAIIEEATDENVEKARNTVNAVNDGADFEGEIKKLGIGVTDESYDMSKIRSLSLSFPAIMNLLPKTEVGNAYAVEDGSGIYILKITERTESGYIPLDDATAYVKNALALEKFNAEISERSNAFD